jgi:hypothetical protein
VHFENQRALTVQQKAISSKSRPLLFGEELTHRAGRRQSHPPDTDSRLLTQMNLSCQLLYDR